jgi:hypothetical protein
MGKIVRAVVDRMEGKLAVLLLGVDEETQIQLPKQYLPVGVKEGSVLSINFNLDQKETDAAKKEAADLIERLQRRGQ